MQVWSTDWSKLPAPSEDVLVDRAQSFLLKQTKPYVVIQNMHIFALLANSERYELLTVTNAEWSHGG